MTDLPDISLMCAPCQRFCAEHPYEPHPEAPRTLARHHGTSLGAHIRCAWAGPRHTFNGYNWNCQTVQAILAILYDARETPNGRAASTRWSDESIGYVVIPSADPELSDGDGFAVLAWTKDYGKLDSATFICGEEVRPLTLDEATRIVRMAR